MLFNVSSINLDNEITTSYIHNYFNAINPLTNSLLTDLILTQVQKEKLVISLYLFKL